MKKSLYLIVFITLISCTTKSSENLPEEEVLELVKDNQGRIKRKVTTGYIPGEDFYLIIEELDTNGNLLKEYGAKPYGKKYKNEFKYDDKNRLIYKIEYDFGDAEFENYTGADYRLYTLNDTVGNFNTKKISEDLRVYYFEDRIQRKVLRYFTDSTGKEDFEINTYIEPIKKESNDHQH